MRTAASFAVAFLVTVALAAPSAAGLEWQGQGQGRGRGQAARPNKPEPKEQKEQKPPSRGPKKGEKGDAVVFDRDGHARVIRDYRTAGLPPGLAKRESLPPGLRRQLRERGELPPGLQKHLVAVPGPLASRLPAIPGYYHRYFAGDDLIVVDTRSNRIVAIVRDVLR
jgi:hypothetical protein